MTTSPKTTAPIDQPTTPNKVKRKKSESKHPNVTDVVAKGEQPLQDDGRFAEQTKVLEAFRKKQRRQREERAVATLVSRGEHVYTHAEVAKMFGIKVDPNWDQDRLQWIVKIGNHVHPMLKLRQRADKLTKQLVEPGRIGTKKVMAAAYKLYLDATASPDQHPIFEELRRYLRSQKINAHKDAPDASIVVRTVFSDFDSKQAHTYGKSLKYAKSNQVAVGDFVKFVDEKGGFEKIRTLAIKVEKKVDLQIEQENEKVREKKTSELLEFSRTEPIIKLELTLDQHVRLKPNVTVTTPDKNMDMIVLLAEMDPYDFKLCNIYGNVPMTAELQKAIEKVLGQVIIFDADFVERFYAWKAKKAPEGPVKTTKEKSSKRVAAWIAREAERDAAQEAASGDTANKQ